MSSLDELFGAPVAVDHRSRWAYLDNRHYQPLRLGDQVVFIRHRALRSLLRVGRRFADEKRVEVGFLCMGRRERDAEGLYTALESFPLVGVGTTARVVMPAESKLAAQRAHPSLDVVGWAHTHPNFGVFFSGTDVENCAHYGPEAVNLVLDPIRWELGFFVETTLLAHIGPRSLAPYIVAGRATPRSSVGAAARTPSAARQAPVATTPPPGCQWSRASCVFVHDGRPAGSCFHARTLDDPPCGALGTDARTNAASCDARRFTDGDCRAQASPRRAVA